ncbi:MAG: filamentous hemagglutinin N-terminal domain-containing protein, partial [Planctomycetes bacterium]|nr:filamentous hemagglutinin N-terminal domain-containing protein [Planctomycetota bacterium]
MRFLMQLIERHYLRRGITYILICCMLFNVPASVVLAGPEGAKVIHGQVSLQQSGLNTVIHASDKSIINYTSFDIARPEIVQFIQPGSNASVLNRIISANPTFIDGTLLANGRVFFVNPAGVIIGSGATINVSQLVASGLNISNDSFINGQYEFVGGGGSVVNYGDISAKSVYLVGKQVTNIGNINCPAGYVVMAAGDRVFLGQPGSSVIVEIGSLTPPANAQTPAEINNEGTVEAAGGTIILAAAGDALSRPIMANMGTLSTSNTNGDAGDISFQAGDGQLDNTGIITATSNSDSGGIITAVAGEVINTGAIDVSGTQGGTVTIDATGRLGQFGTVNADGIESDGGNINLTAEEIVVLGTDSLTTANAGTNGDGGEVIAYSPSAALFESEAQVEAKGGSESGDGGFFEVSGLEYVKIEGQVDLTANNGAAGNFLIDPRNIQIVDDTDNDYYDWDDSDPDKGILTGTEDTSRIPIFQIENYLDTTNVTISTDGPVGNGIDGDVTFMASRYLKSGANNLSDNSLTVIAHHDIIFQPGSGIDFGGSGSVILQAGNKIDVKSNINLNSGDFISTGIGFDNTGGEITTSGGLANIDHTGDVVIGANIDTTGGAGSSISINGSSITVNKNITAGDNITFYNAVEADGGNQVFDAGAGTLLAQDTITKTSTGNLTLGGDAGIDLEGTGDSVNVTGGSLTIEDVVDAEGNLAASGLIRLYGDTSMNYIAGNIS